MHVITLHSECLLCMKCCTATRTSDAATSDATPSSVCRAVNDLPPTKRGAEGGGAEDLPSPTATTTTTTASAHHGTTTVVVPPPPPPPPPPPGGIGSADCLAMDCDPEPITWPLASFVGVDDDADEHACCELRLLQGDDDGLLLGFRIRSIW